MHCISLYRTYKPPNGHSRLLGARLEDKIMTSKYDMRLDSSAIVRRGLKTIKLTTFRGFATYLNAMGLVTHRKGPHSAEIEILNTSRSWFDALSEIWWTSTQIGYAISNKGLLYFDYPEITLPQTRWHTWLAIFFRRIVFEWATRCRVLVRKGTVLFFQITNIL